MTETINKELRPYRALAVKVVIISAMTLLVAIFCYIDLKQRFELDAAAIVACATAVAFLLLTAVIVLFPQSLDEFAGKVILAEWDPFSRSWQIQVRCYQDRRWVDQKFKDACLPKEEKAYEVTYDRYSLPRYKVDEVSEPNESKGGSSRIITIYADIGVDIEKPLDKNDVVTFAHDVIFGRRVTVLGRLRESAQ